MKIYTKTGDDGTTSLYSGRRLSKAHARVEAYGTVDELNAQLGLLATEIEDPSLRGDLVNQQHYLFALGAALADDRENEAYQLPAKATPDLEEDIDRMNEELPAMTHFILPGGSRPVALAHVCRTVCRRAERRMVELSESAGVGDDLIVYINRLSDYLFVLSRYLAHTSGVEETKWISA